jgi:hypothetical protein
VKHPALGEAIAALREARERGDDDSVTAALGELCEAMHRLEDGRRVWGRAEAKEMFCWFKANESRLHRDWFELGYYSFEDGSGLSSANVRQAIGSGSLSSFACDQLDGLAQLRELVERTGTDL